MAGRAGEACSSSDGSSVNQTGAIAHGTSLIPGDTATGRQDSIDLVRALGVLAVIVYHYCYRFPPEYLHNGVHVEAFAFGRLGVNLFFIISAFCISGSLDRSRSALQFYSKRVARLYPAYAVCTLLTFAIVTVFGLPGRAVSEKVLTLNLLWFNMVLPVPHVDGAYWTLLYELRFYALIGLAYFALRRDYNRVTVFWRIITLFGVALHFGAIASEGSDWAAPQRILAANLFLYPFAAYFLLGITLFRWASVTARHRTINVALFAFGVMCSEYDWTDKVVCLAFFPLTWLLLRARRLRVPRPVLHIGLVSYPLYLLHQNIGLVAIRETWPAINSFAIRAILAFGLVLFGAILVNYRIEPLLRRPFEWALLRAGEAVSHFLTVHVRRRERAADDVA